MNKPLGRRIISFILLSIGVLYYESERQGSYTRLRLRLRPTTHNIICKSILHLKENYIYLAINDIDMGKVLIERSPIK